MPCDDADQLITIRWMRKQFQRSKQTSGYQKRLSNRSISDGFGTGIGAVMTQIKAGDCGQPVEPVSTIASTSVLFPVPTKRVCGDGTNIRMSYCHFPTVSLVLPSRIARSSPTPSSLFANKRRVRSSLLRSSGARFAAARAMQPAWSGMHAIRFDRLPPRNSAQARDSSGWERAKSRPKVTARRSA